MQTLTRTLSGVVAPLIALSPIISGCTTAIENRPPYACKVIPHHLFDLQVDSDEEHLPVETKVIEGSFTSDFYDCVAEKAGMRYFYQQWQDRRFAEGRNYMTSGRYDDAVDLPVELGEGWIDVPLGIGWMSWRCDDRAVISRFSAPGDRDRDEQEDTQRLLEIAQQRYAELNDCEIRPPE